MKTSAIYEPQGKARDYAKLAVNLYQGCSHQCVYCYSPAYIHSTRDEFHQPKPRLNIIQKIKQDAKILQSEREKTPVLMCFTCDPYQPTDEKYQFSRQTIQILHSCGINVMILTKGGQRAERDFDILTNKDWLGVTLTNLDNTLSLEWEPGAALPDTRINSLVKAHKKGIKTWVSLEPVIYPEVTLEIIRQTHSFVDHFKVGTLNYHPHTKSIDWHKFAVDVKTILTEFECDYYLKLSIYPFFMCLRIYVSLLPR